MYKRLSELRGQFIELLQYHPEGRMRYIGKLISLDSETAEMQFYDPDGIEMDRMFFPLNSIVGVGIGTAESLGVEARVKKRQGEVVSLKKIFDMEVKA